MGKYVTVTANEGGRTGTDGSTPSPPCWDATSTTDWFLSYEGCFWTPSPPCRDPTSTEVEGEVWTLLTCWQPIVFLTLSSYHGDTFKTQPTTMTLCKMTVGSKSQDRR